MNEFLFIALLVVALCFLLRLPITLANHFSRNDPKPEEEPNKGYGYISSELESNEMLLSKDEFDNIVKLH